MLPPVSHRECASIITRIEDICERRDSVFCYFNRGGREQTISYSTLLFQSRRYATALQKRGLEKGEVVLILLDHTPELLYAFIGAMQAGGIPSFMPPLTSKQDPAVYWVSHQKLFDRIAPATLLTAGHVQPALRNHLSTDGLKLVTLEDCLASDGRDFRVESAGSLEIALLQHSSGTTGLKKGVALSHRAVIQQVEYYAQALALSPSDCIVSWLPLYHDMGLIACFLLPMLTGTPVVMMDPQEWVVNPKLLFQAIYTHRGTLCWQPNFAFHHLRRTVRPSKEFDVSSMRAWIDCSEPCRPETFQLFADRFADIGVTPRQLQVCYAMAESVFAVTQTTPGEPYYELTADPEILRRDGLVVAPAKEAPSQRLLSTGRPIAGMEVCIVNNSGDPLPEDTVGEITLRSEFLFAGYYRLEEQTQSKLRDGVYFTGDLGFLRDGELYVTGRKNDLIIVHGRNYYAHELEYVINQVSGVHPGRNVALGIFRPEVGSEDVIVLCEQPTGESPDLVSLKKLIKDALLSQANLWACPDSSDTDSGRLFSFAVTRTGQGFDSRDWSAVDDDYKTFRCIGRSRCELRLWFGSDAGRRLRI